MSDTSLGLAKVLRNLHEKENEHEHICQEPGVCFALLRLFA